MLSHTITYCNTSPPLMSKMSEVSGCSCCSCPLQSKDLAQAIDKKFAPSGIYCGLCSATLTLRVGTTPPHHATAIHKHGKHPCTYHSMQSSHIESTHKESQEGTA